MSPKTARSAAAPKRPSLGQTKGKVSLPVTAVFSFLKETRGISSWTTRGLARTLNCTNAGARQVLSILDIQGYVKPLAKDEWMTTPAGETVSGSKFPRYSREAVERSLASFADHLKLVNRDPSAEYKITDAVAFGDFMSERTRVQAADVGIELQARNPMGHRQHYASEQGRQETFLKQLRGRTPLVNLRPYAEWMGSRTHRKLV